MNPALKNIKELKKEMIIRENITCKLSMLRCSMLSESSSKIRRSISRLFLKKELNNGDNFRK